MLRWLGRGEGVTVGTDEAGYRAFITHGMEGLRRTAFLLCGDWHTADDLVSMALVKLLRHWRQVAAMEQPDAYVRRMLLRVYIDEKRRPWRREDFVQSPPDRPQSTADIANTLVLSERTVASHVRNILVKTGLTSRTELLRWHLERRD